MDFQNQQEEAQQNTTRLVALLILGVAAIILVVAALLIALLYYGSGDFQPLTAFAVAAPLTTLGVTGASMVKSSQIRSGGGSYVAASLGGRKVDFNTLDPDERQLANVVEEIAVASGVPSPAVFVLDGEPGINAFAAGWTADSSAIGVTRGALDHLNRRELQGVIAHEFSHIRNGDTRVKTRIIGWVFGIAVITVLGRILLQQLWWAPRRRNREDNSAMLMVAAGFGLIIIGSVGTLFARMIQAAVSRQREYLADASAVQYTRDPSGIGDALIKIAAMGGENRVQSAHATEASHLFFSSAFNATFATHPPLGERIRRLMPDWDGKIPTLDDGGGVPVDRTPPPMPRPGAAWGPSPFPPIMSGFDDSSRSEPVMPNPGVRQTFDGPSFGGPSDAHIEHSRTMLAQIPQETRNHLRTKQGAVAAIVGSVISTNPDVRPLELAAAGQILSADPGYVDAASRLISDLERPLQLPAIDIALHTVQQTPRAYRIALGDVIQDLERSNVEGDLFRWVLRRVVLRHLEDQHDDGSAVHALTLLQVTPEVATVYAVLARYNSSGDGEAQASFDAALDVSGSPSVPMPTDNIHSFVGVDEALEKLSRLDRPSREAFVSGAAAAVLFDRKITAAEAELLRVVADAVRLPVPPLLPV